MKKGFTLIELLVVVLIIGILAAAALPQYTKAVQKGRNAQLKTAIRSTIQAQQVYKLANGVLAPSFDLLDIDWGLSASESNPCFLITTGNNSKRHGKDFYIVLNNASSESGSVTAVWSDGKYKCAGFSYYMQGRDIKCVEAANGSSSISNGDFCEKIENAVYEDTSSGWRHYRLP